MPNYRFRCAEGCEFDAMYSMSDVPRQAECAACGALAKRVITAPHLSASGGSAYGLLDRAARSAHEPQVVDRLPGRGAAPRQPVSRNPLHAKLPRP
ncbi:FmdB family zinc ribbon protein [Leucobacter chromiiresistens]|uniref:Putative regulatory protein, FmdB family n=1 Tax=Leucobacter chromiiresistens TaxID=1079994 RepID=A0A1H1BP75_9MICO|nr:FmdB family zinc ribbon protein [Leucobacter chromiiresistens]SDQ53673.1 putative regulatory protein, FmdB family [Leucobacter chromiiresistens]